MKNIRLKTLSIKNFKGVSAFALNLDGGHTAVFGDNATGKSTLFDSFLWLLWGKDSFNRTDFEIKPIGGKGPKPETHVEAVLDMGDTELSLKKVYAEKWTRKRGTASPEFTGHTVDHFVNGVPSKKKEFDEAVKGICDEALARLLTNPRHFSEVLNKEQRLEILFSLCGTITEADVIASDPELADLTAILNGHPVDDYKKIIAGQRTEFNRELQKIPVRIDEIKSSAREVPGTKDLLESTVKNLEAKRDEKMAQLQQLSSGGEIPAINKEIAVIEGQLIALDNERSRKVGAAQAAYDQQARDLQRKEQKLLGDLSDANQRRARFVRDAEEFEKRAAALVTSADNLRARWGEENKKTLEYEPSLTCPTCGQDLPEDQVEAAREKALASFNAEKAKKLTTISEEGKLAMAKASEFKTDALTARQTAEKTEAEIERLTAAHKQSIAACEDFKKTEVPPVPHDPRRAELVEKQAALKAKIEEALAGADTGARAELSQEIATLNASIDGFKKDLVQIEANRRIDARVEELSKLERDLAADFERVERQLHLLDLFVRARARLIEERVNSQFQLVKFQLFEVQINGGIEKVCNVTVNGVPYNSLNNAMRINAGLDICETLSRHHGICLPIFVDNAEAVTDLFETIAQQIRLYVSESDKQLRIEEVAA